MVQHRSMTSASDVAVATTRQRPPPPIALTMGIAAQIVAADASGASHHFLSDTRVGGCRALTLARRRCFYKIAPLGVGARCLFSGDRAPLTMPSRQPHAPCARISGRRSCQSLGGGGGREGEQQNGPQVLQPLARALGFWRPHGFGRPAGVLARNAPQRGPHRSPPQGLGPNAPQRGACGGVS